MQLAQPYPTNPGTQFGGYDPRSTYPSQSYIDPRLSGPQGYAPQSNAPHYQQTVYPDAVYPSQHLPQGRPDVMGHQQMSYPHQANQYNQQYYNSNQQPHYAPTHNLPFAREPHYAQSSYMTQNRPAMQNPRTQVKSVKQVIYEQQPLNIPQPVRNIQYIPQLNRYMDYVQERIKIPVEKYYTDYYEIEHVTDFVPREYEESVIEMVPEQIIRYRLEYVPVERKIVHMPKNHIYEENGLFKGVGNLADRVHIEDAVRGLADGNVQNAQGQINRALYENLSHSQSKGLNESLVNGIIREGEGEQKSQTNINKMLYQGLNRVMGTPSHTLQQNISRNIYSQVSESRNINSYSNLPQNQILEQAIYQAASRNASSQRSKTSRRRSNFVTSDGYFPNYEEELRNMESSLSASRERYY